MNKRWLTMPPQERDAEDLAKDLGVSALLAQLLIHRGLTSLEEARRFLRPELSDLHDPRLLPGLDRGLDRLIEALQAGESILIFGDYDVDGVTSVSLLMHLLKPLAGGKVYYYVPKRLEEGYGLSLEAIKRAAAQGISLILTADCGISACAEVAAAGGLGLDVIVTDHHEPGEKLPEAVAVINPKMHGSRYPFSGLAGVGVAFKLGQALMERGLLTADDLWRRLDLVALGTIADVVPLLDENRILVHHGLMQLNKTEHPGLRALLEAVQLHEKTVTAGQVGYVLAPRLNASGRIGDASAGVKLLLTREAQRGRDLAQAIEHENEERQRIEARVLAEALIMIKEQVDLANEHALVLASPSWHAGVIGIVASRLVDLYHRPVILIALDAQEGRGSGRSIPGFNLYQGILSCARYLERFGGHEAAAGLTVSRERLADFTREFTAMARAEIAASMLQPTLKIEAEINLAEANLGLARELMLLAPFGSGNPAPVLASRSLKPVDLRTIGENGKHLKIRVMQQGILRNAIGFSLGGCLPEIKAADRVDLAFMLEENTFNGNTDVQLNLKDIICPSQGERLHAAE